MKAHSLEMRKRVIELANEGKYSQEHIAEILGASSRWIRRVLRRWRETGSAELLPHAGGPPPKVTRQVQEQLREFAAEYPDATLEEFRQGCGLSVSLVAICRALQRLGLRRKKKVTQATEQDRPDVQAKRRTWKRKERKLNVKKLVFVDEAGVSTQMQRSCGRAPQGVRVRGSIPQDHFHSWTLTGGMRWNGRLATLVYDGGTDVAALLAFVNTQLLPQLKRGDIVVWDNLQTHKSPQVIAAIEQAGASVMALPPYSPDFNPIEQLWSKVKTSLRGAAARTKEDLMNALKAALKTITPEDIQHWCQHCGYRTVPS